MEKELRKQLVASVVKYHLNKISRSPDTLYFVILDKEMNTFVNSVVEDLLECHLLPISGMGHLISNSANTCSVVSHAITYRITHMLCSIGTGQNYMVSDVNEQNGLTEALINEVEELWNFFGRFV